MATRTYLFTPEESAQFERLQALGFTRTDRLSGTEEASVLWQQEAQGVDFTFFTEPYEFESDEDEPRELYWHVEVHGKTDGGQSCIVCDHFLTLAEFDRLTSPQHWPTVLSALPEVRGTVALQAFLHTLVEATEATTPTLPDPTPCSLCAG